MHHVHVPEAPRIADFDGAQVGAHRHGLGLHHQDRRRGALRQARAPAQQQVFQAPLQGGVEGGADQRRAVAGVQPPRQQRRQSGFLARREQQRLLTGLLQPLGGPDAIVGQPLQHLVARALGAFRMAVGAQPAGRLGQHGEQGRFGVGQVQRRLAQVGPTGRRHPLQGAAERRAVEVDLQNLRFRQVPFELRRAPQLAQLAAQGAVVRVEQARHLHRQGAAARDHAPPAQIEPGRARQGHGVDPGMAVEPAVFVGQQRLQVQRRDLLGSDRVAPYTVGIGEAPQGRAVFGQHHAGQVVARQRQRPQAVGHPQQRQHQQDRQHRAAAQAPGTAARGD